MKEPCLHPFASHDGELAYCPTCGAIGKFPFEDPPRPEPVPAVPIESGGVFRYRDSRGIFWAVPTFVEAMRFEGDEIEGPLREDE